MSRSPYTLVRDMQTSLLDPHTRLAVLQQDRIVGRVERTPDGRWRVIDAGMGVDVPDRLANWAQPDQAADHLLHLREHSPAVEVVEGLTGAERGILDLEGEWFRLPGSKANAIRERFGITETRYYQVLNRLLDNPDALAYAPYAVARLRRVRETAAARRSSLRLAPVVAL